MGVSTVLRAAIAIAAASACVAVAGCGGSSPVSGSAKPVSRVLAAMQSAVARARSVRVSANLIKSGQPIRFNVTFAGSAFAGGYTARGGVSIYVVTVAGETYQKLNSTVLSAAGISAGECPKICGKYVQLTSNVAKRVVGDVSLASMVGPVGTLVSSMNARGLVFKPTSYDGQSVLMLSWKGTSLDVAASGVPYPVRLSGNNSVSIEFSDWNNVPPIKAPAASQIVSHAEITQIALPGYF